MLTIIQKPIEDIIEYFEPEERVFVVGYGNCAAKCHAGGEAETKEMAERLKRRGVKVAGWACTGNGKSLCKLSLARKMLTEEHKSKTGHADSFRVLACDRGIRTVTDATDGGIVYVGCIKRQPKWRSLWLKIKGRFGTKI